MSNWNDGSLTTIPYHNSYDKFMTKEKEKEYFKELENFLQKDIDTYGDIREIYPQKELVFNVLNLCPLDNIKVVILGQDPYINPNEAMGLSFSVPKTTKIPPSLINIYSELVNDPKINLIKPNHGDLTTWVQQGVFLLNASLTVRQKKSNSHYKYWKEFTNNLIKYISKKRKNVVFCLWGNFAKDKKEYIKNQDNHYIIETAHPSPLSANKAHQNATFEKKWFNNFQFSLINEYLLKNNIDIVNWNSINGSEI